MNVQPVPDLPEFATWLNATPCTLTELRGRPVALLFVNAASAWSAQRLAEFGQWLSRHPGKLQPLVLQVLALRFRARRQCRTEAAAPPGPGHARTARCRLGWLAPLRRYRLATVVLLDAQGREQQRLVGQGATGELERALNTLCQARLRRRRAAAANCIRNHASAAVPAGPGGQHRTPVHRRQWPSPHSRMQPWRPHPAPVRPRYRRFHGRNLAEAAFHRPQALVLERDSLYVADTGNHAVRRINLLTASSTRCVAMDVPVRRWKVRWRRRGRSRWTILSAWHRRQPAAHRDGRRQPHLELPPGPAQPAMARRQWFHRRA